MKLKRLVSAVLAVGMALTILPTAAFAAKNYTTNITRIVLDGNGLVDGAASGGTYNEANKTWSGTGWTISAAGSFSIGDNSIFNERSATGTVKSKVFNNGKIEGGHFEGDSNAAVFNYGVISGGIFSDITNCARKATDSGVIENAIIKNYTASRVTDPKGTTTLSDSIVWGNVAIGENIENTISDSIISNIPARVEDKYSPQIFTVEGGLIQPDIVGIPDEAVFQGKAYLIGNPSTRTFKVKPASTKTFEKWDYVETTGAMIDEDPETHELTVTLPATGNVTIKAVMERTKLVVGVVDGKTVPVYSDGTLCNGSDFDGWTYSEDADGNGTLKVYNNSVDDYAIDLGDAEVDWNVENEGVIKGGTFNYQDERYSVLQNKEGGQIIGGTFNVRVSNRGIIDGGTFNKTVNNYKTVNGGIFTARYSNTATTVNVSGGKTEITSVGETTGGIFSHYADFYGQDNLEKTTVTLNNCTANGISDLVYVVGNQTLNIEADATSWKGWTANAESDLKYEEALKAKLPATSSFELTVNGGTDPNFTLTAQVAEGYYRMNLVDGTATVNDKEVTSAKAGQTVTLTAADAPDGMVFDRWEITPTDAALNLEGFDANAATTSFVMPAQTLTIRAMYRMADVEEPNVLGTAAVIGTVAVGGAVVAWQGYNIAADIYARDILPEGTAIPETKEALAVMLWQNAGKPEVVAADGTALTETEQAQQWVVANGLMENEADGTFHPEKGVGKFAALNAIKAQNEAKVNE